MLKTKRIRASRLIRKLQIWLQRARSREFSEDQLKVTSDSAEKPCSRVWTCKTAAKKEGEEAGGSSFFTAGCSRSLREAGDSGTIFRAFTSTPYMPSFRQPRQTSRSWLQRVTRSVTVTGSRQIRSAYKRYVNDNVHSNVSIHAKYMSSKEFS